eukprot:NODE_6905_length_339_cov_78.220690_g6175_i0.p3 GENE.NODE_6905_length_339_cov_78.220690_g6175_i0~~NODE_6905_length_339_cov_78.220690_g6175_i0.p3  ORF type:complete len:57 (+),score=17.86 NODE_6905_length_339_cov_78.220690_g6175_i0:75-245(+)
MSDDAAEAIRAVEQFKADEEFAQRMQVADEFEAATAARDNAKSEAAAKKMASQTPP